ncbi:MAG TPA: patatin-like phospholipase family protein [Nitrososphaeraceae archaeon]|nr:patatin-like phospholipase family protein [Nitrososphaeraceae archaeon]
MQFEYVVSEGSTVIFDALEFTMDKRVGNTKPYDENKVKFDSFKQISHGIQVNLTKEQNDRIYSFKAPYIRDENRVTTTLNFRVYIADKNTASNEKIPYDAKVVVKRVHRAIIFQGGVALGAYEAGVFQALVEKLSAQEEDDVSKKLKDEKRPLFDIIGGTSIGAMNAAIVASSVIKHGNNHDSKSWKNAVEKVRQFWNYQKSELPTVADSLDMNPFYHFWWDNLHNTSRLFKRSTAELLETNSELFEAAYSNMNPFWKKWYDFTARYWFHVDPSFWKDYFLDGWYVPATAESARRYYSAEQFEKLGAQDAATGIIPWSIFGRFFDFTDISNSVPRVDNKHFVLYSLKETLGRLADFPIEIEKEQKIKERQPRFLLVAVDVKTGDAVTFDSYSEETKYHEDKNSIPYKKGIEIEHALASGTFPGFFDYPKFKVDNNSNPESTNEEHIFWDGGYRSNTPLREVIQAHRDYWHKIRKHKEEEEDKDEYENDVPDLEVYIANLWPSELKEEPISYDLDFVENRKLDLLLADRTDYDEKVANVVSDYVDLVKRLKNLAERKSASKPELDYILGRYGSSISTTGETRKYKDLLGGRFRLTKVVRIDHKDDGNNVAGKIFDYSHRTVEKLVAEGYNDALIQMDIRTRKDEVKEWAKKES